MRGRIKYLTTDKILLWGFLGSVFFLLLSALCIAFSYRYLPPYLPLFNQLSWGKARLGQRIEILWPLGIVTLVIVGNFFYASVLYTKIPLVARILCLTSLLVGFFSLLFLIRTILLVLY